MTRPIWKSVEWQLRCNSIDPKLVGLQRTGMIYWLNRIHPRTGIRLDRRTLLILDGRYQLHCYLVTSNPSLSHCHHPCYHYIIVVIIIAVIITPIIVVMITCSIRNFIEMLLLLCRYGKVCILVTLIIHEDCCTCLLSCHWGHPFVFVYGLKYIEDTFLSQMMIILDLELGHIEIGLHALSVVDIFCIETMR